MESHPVTVGLTLANEVIIDRATLKPSIIGAFTGLGVQEFPSTPQRFSVWSVLTNGSGTGIIQLRVFSARSRDQIYSQQGVLQFPDVSDMVHTSFRVKSIRFPEAGYYLFRLFIDDSPIPQAMCRLRVYEGKDFE